MMSSSVVVWRRFASAFQAILLLGLPFVSLRGESLLRFDIASQTLHVFGAAIAMDEFFLVLAAILFVSFFAVFLTVLFGRIWCGWLCPQTAMIELTRFVDQPGRQSIFSRSVQVFSLLLISCVIAADLIWYFVPPSEFFSRLFSASVGPVVSGFWIVLALILFLDLLLVRRTFCATICPYAKLQGTLFDEWTLVIAADQPRMDACMHCNACVLACPVKIDIRKGLDAACVACAECVDACAKRMKKRQQRSLIRYRFGTGEKGVNWFRKSVLLAGVSATAFLILLMILLVGRTSLDMIIVPDSASPPRMMSGDIVTNGYIATIENRTAREVTLALRATSPGGDVEIIPDTAVIHARSQQRIHITALVKFAGGKSGSSLPLTIKAVSTVDASMQVKADATFLPSW